MEHRGWMRLVRVWWLMALVSRLTSSGQLASGVGLTIASSGSNQLSLAVTAANPRTNYEVYRRTALDSASPWALHQVGLIGQSNFLVERGAADAGLFTAGISGETDLDGAYGSRPPMGYTTWFTLFTHANEVDVRARADFLVTNHLVECGWKTLIVSDSWQGGRDTDGNLYADPIRFPSGMPALADYIASRGLRLGIYTEPNPVTSGGFTGSADHFDQDAATFATWGVKYVQFDAPYGGSTPMDQNKWIQSQVVAWRASMGKAHLKAFLTTGGFGSLFSSWPPSTWFGPWMPELLNSWRFAVDGDLVVFLPAEWLVANAFAHINHAAMWAAFVGPGHIVDPDILPVHHLSAFGRIDPADFSPDDAKMIAAMQAMLAAPLIVDDFPDPETMPESFQQIMHNREFIAVDQDPLCLMARLVGQTNEVFWQIWAKPMVDGSVAVALLNRSIEPANFSFTFTDLGFSQSVCTVRDVWQQATVAYATNGYATTVKPGFAQLLRVNPGIQRPFPDGTNYLSDVGWLAGAVNGTTNSPPGGASAVRIYRDAVHNPGVAPGRYAPTNMVMNGKVYRKGLGLCANGTVRFFLGGFPATMHGEFGLDDGVTGEGKGVRFRLWGDGRLLWDSGTLLAGQAPVLKYFDLARINVLEIQTLAVGPDPSGCWGDIGEAYFLAGAPQD